MTRLYAARVAARLRKELGIDVDMQHGRYGEIKVLIDGDTVVDAGRLGMLGILPPTRKVVETVRARLAGHR
jgi:hypothetical protein